MNTYQYYSWKGVVVALALLLGLVSSASAIETATTLQDITLSATV